MKGFENKILDDFYEMKGDELEKLIIRQYGKPDEVKKGEKVEKELLNVIKEIVTDEEKLKMILKQLNDFEGCTSAERDYWNKHYYKVGFIDGMSLLKQIKEERIADSNPNNSIIYQNFSQITELFEEQKYKKLKARTDYNQIIEKIEDIKRKYPKVRAFFEDEEIAEFSKEETKAILDITDLQSDISTLEIEEMFKIGLKEGKAL